MHLGDGMISLECAVVGYAAAAVGVGAATIMAGQSATPRASRFAGALALIFAAQAFNFPVSAQTSGHMLGGFLLAYWFGAGWGVLGMTLVLAAQSVLYADGGIAALGLNVVSMALVPCLVMYPLWRSAYRTSAGADRWPGMAIAAWSAVMFGAFACGLAVTLSGAARGEAWRFLGELMGVHALIGMAEVVLTLTAIALVRHLSKLESVQLRAATAGAGILALATAAALGASPWPDGLESSLAAWSALPLEVEAHAWTPWPEYEPLWSGPAGCGVLAIAGAAAVMARRTLQARAERNRA